MRGPDLIRVAFGAGTPEANRAMLDEFERIRPDLPLYVISEFAPDRGEWIPYHPSLPRSENKSAICAALKGKSIAAAAVVIEPHPPLKPLVAQAFSLCNSIKDRTPLLLFASQGDIIPPNRLILWRIRRMARGLKRQFASGGRARRWLHRLAHPSDAEIPVRARAAQLYGIVASRIRAPRRIRPMHGHEPLAEGVTVIVPSRDGRHLLERLFDSLAPQLSPHTGIIVVDNGSSDGTSAWLAATHPAVLVIHAEAPLSFARAINLGLEKARFNRVLLLNNDMVVQPGFLDALGAAFNRVPDLFCATAHIFFPGGARREETGKAVWRRASTTDLPLRCDVPIEGEDLTYVLYGSGGCSLYDTAKLRALGGLAELFHPAYVEDLDAGFRAWKQGWPSVFVRNARVEHLHRATTSRCFTRLELESFLERNFLNFLIHAIGSPALFRKLWRESIRRLQLNAMSGSDAALNTLRAFPHVGPKPPRPSGPLSESEIFALGSGDIAIFPGRAHRNARTVVIASPYLPFPLSHGGAVRIYNLMREAAETVNQVLICFCDNLALPAPELLAICAEVILVRRRGSHLRPHSPRPDTVEEFDSETFRACLKQTVRKWRPGIVQLEFTWMAQYANACSPAKSILVEHDVTFDLQQQLLGLGSASSLRRHELRVQSEKWRAFETAAWKQADAIVVMSAKDAGLLEGAKQFAILPNGVDTSRFQASDEPPEPKRLLFIGSFAHLPNVLALEFFIRDVMPLLGPGYKLHVIAGARPEYYLDFHRGRLSIDLSNRLNRPEIELDGFVADVRPAYRRAEIVVAPLTASAGTNIKVLEAMAMGRAVVSTHAGINGLDLSPGKDVIVADSPAAMAAAIEELSANPGRRREIERNARQTALLFDWQSIARRQIALYDRLYAETP